MPHISALITPAVLRWAREQAGYDLQTAAQKMGVAVESLKQWEQGDIRPSLPQARKAAEIYHRPLAVFFLQKPPSDFQTPRDFRRLPGDFPRQFSPEFLFLARSLTYGQQWLVEYRRDTGYDEFVHAGSATMSDAATLARSIRSILGIGTHWNQQCSDRSKALLYWISKVEEIGVCVRRDPGVEVQEARGLALSDRWAPIIWINGKDASAAQLFTLAHELTHVWLGESGVSNLAANGNAPPGAAELEVFCNRVAASLLVSPEAFEHESGRLHASSGTEAISRLAERLKVSEEVVARILLEHRSIAASDYRRLREEFHQRWKRLIRKKGKRGPPYLTLKIAQNGRLFTSEVLHAYHDDYATATEASDLLDMKINQFPKLASQLRHVRTGGGSR